MKKLIWILLLGALAAPSYAQSLTMDPCIWSGSYVKCLPSIGLFLNGGQSLSLGPDTNDGHYVELKSALSMSSSYALVFPSTNGTDGQSLELVNGSFIWFTPFSSAAFTAYKEALPMKMSAEAASTANVNMLAGNPGTIDGVDLSFGGTVLLKNQTDPMENGLWFVDFAGVWTRDSTMPNNAASAYSAIVAVNAGGTVNGNTLWYSRSTGDGNVPFVEIPTTASNNVITASRALVSSSTGFITPATTTATEIGYVNGVTSAIQTQLNAKLTDPMTTQGDIIYENVTPAPARLARGTATQLLHSDTTPSWSAASLTADVSGVLPIANGGTNGATKSAGFDNLSPMTAAGDVIYGGTAGTGTTLAKGTSTQLLHSGTTPTWSAVSLTADVTGTLPVGNGGTGQAANWVAGGVVYGASTSALGVTSAGTSQNWVLSGGTGAPTMSNTTTTGKFIDGSADEIQMRVQGNGTQTSNILTVEKSDATLLLNVTNTAGTAIRGTTSNDTAAAGFVGEYLEDTVAIGSEVSLTSTQYLQISSTGIALTAGTWDIDGVIGFDVGTGTVVSSGFAAFYSTATGNNTTGRDVAKNYIEHDVNTSTTFGSGGLLMFTLPRYRVNLTATTTYYLKGNSTFSVSTVKIFGTIRGTRIR